MDVIVGSSFEIPKGLVQALIEVEEATVLTGAGTSAESGVPTFRDAQTGLWAQYDPQELATSKAFGQNPQLVWEWYDWRRQLVSKAEPNPGHLALAYLEDHFLNLTLITQNVDGLHQRAGSTGLIELHGNITRTKCSIEDRIVTRWTQGQKVPPRCPHCGGRLRPDVVWFGESLPQSAIDKAIYAAANCKLFLSIGTSSLVQPAASLPHIAHRNGAIIVEINPDETPLTPYADYYLRGPSGTVLPSILKASSIRKHS